MPLFHLVSNESALTAVPKSQVTTQLLKTLSVALAETSGKPESLCQVSVKSEVPMTFGGTEDPTAFAEYICIGTIGGKVNEGITAKMSSVIEEELKVPKERFYIKFVDPAPADVGLNGTTCQVLFYGG